MTTVNLEWKEFSVNLSKLRAALKTLLSSDYDGLAASPDGLTVVFKVPVGDSDSTALSAYWDAVTPSTFAPTMEEIVQLKISTAIQFGNKVIVDASTANVLQGITQAGKTKEVSDFLRSLGRYLREGSLYAALVEIDALISQGVPEDIQTWVSADKLNGAKLKIQTFLGIAP